MAYIQFLGAAGTVTGSKHLINLSGDPAGKGLQVLVDCGLFQGQKEWRERNWQASPVAPSQIEAVILTHAHLDHSGWLPRLVKEGFRGAIYATPATIDLCGVLLTSSAHHSPRLPPSSTAPLAPCFLLATSAVCATPKSLPDASSIPARRRANRQTCW